MVVVSWAIFFALGLLGAVGDLFDDGGDSDPAVPEVTGATGVSGETLVVGPYAVTVAASFSPTVPELGNRGYLVAEIDIEGETTLLPLAPLGFFLVGPDGTRFPDPFRPADDRLVWEIGSARGEFHVVWETPEITDDSTATWTVLLL